MEQKIYQLATNKLTIFIIILLVNFLYLKLAIKYEIVDKPNHRSSHDKVTVRGGGIIFPIAVFLWWLSSDFSNSWMFLGMILISSVSMLDDIFTLSRKVRFGTQFIAISLAFYDLGLFYQEPFWVLPILYFFSLGVINAINFMDGINGISGLYFLVFFGSLLAINEYLPIFEENLIYYIIIALFVFLIFNLRKKALMFAGDIGSISLAYLTIYFLAKWYLTSGDWTIILLLLVYGVDSFGTLVQRLVRGENVALPHRTHLYQIFANQLKKNHVLIAMVYALLQLFFNMVFFIFPQSNPSSSLAAAILVGITVVYLGVKVPLSKKHEVFENN